jgi:hypothetical protein
LDGLLVFTVGNGRIFELIKHPAGQLVTLTTMGKAFFVNGTIEQRANPFRRSFSGPEWLPSCLETTGANAGKIGALITDQTTGRKYHNYF